MRKTRFAGVIREWKLVRVNGKVDEIEGRIYNDVMGEKDGTYVRIQNIIKFKSRGKSYFVHTATHMYRLSSSEAFK